MDLFTFEPGDGCSYRIVFGRMPGRGLVPFYTVFGIAEGSAEAGSWYAFDTDQVSMDTFMRHLDNGRGEPATLRTGWRLWLALTGQADDPDVAALLPNWKPTWRKQLPLAARG